MRRAAAFVRAVLGASLALAFVGCELGSSRYSDQGSAGEHAALEAFFEDPLFGSTPPSTGDVVEETQETRRRESSHEPGASRTYELVSDGHDVAVFYKEQAEEHGWGVRRGKLDRPQRPAYGKARVAVL